MSEEMSMEEQSHKAQIMEYLTRGLKIKLDLSDDKIEAIMIAFDIIYDIGFCGGKTDSNREMLYMMKKRDDIVRNKVQEKLESYKERLKI